MEEKSLTPPATGSWRELLGRRHLAVATVLAGGVLLEASNVYLTTSLLPTVVDDIGGADFYAWTMTSFITASVISAMLVSRVLTSRGSVGAYLLAFGLFGAGSVVVAISPTMSVFLAGRVVQGLGGGLLAGLGYALLQRALPERLWARGAALVSAMWGVGNLAGPTVGGAFGEAGAWRPAFGLLAALSALLGLLVLRVLPRTERARPSGAMPIGSLALLTGAVAAVSVADVLPGDAATAVAIAAGAALGWWFLAHERSTASGVLPAATWARGSSLRWVYVTVAALAFGIGTETFIPLFGQEIGGLTPLLAGFLGASLSFGWSVSQVASAAARRPGLVRALLVSGPAVLALGLALTAAAQAADPDRGLVALWFVTLFLAGVGIGLSFPHLTVAALGAVDDEEEAAKAAAAINTALLIASAFSAASAGVLVGLGEPSIVTSARYLLGGFALVALLGVLPGRAAAREASRAVADDQASTVPAH